MELVQAILTWLFCCFRPAIKWFLRQTTRLCELQRICYGETPGAHRTCAVGKFEFLIKLLKFISYTYLLHTIPIFGEVPSLWAPLLQFKHMSFPQKIRISSNKTHTYVV